MLVNLIKHEEPCADKMYLYVQDPLELMRQFLTNGREKVGTANEKKSEALIDYSQTVGDVYVNLEDCNSTKKEGVLIVLLS